MLKLSFLILFWMKVVIQADTLRISHIEIDHHSFLILFWMGVAVQGNTLRIPHIEIYLGNMTKKMGTTFHTS